MVLPFDYLPPITFPLGFREPEDHLYFSPPRPVLLRVLARTGQTAGPQRGNSRAGFTRRLTYPLCPENEICAAPIGICRHSRAALLVLFYHCQNVLQTGIPRLIGSSREKVYPSLTVRACDGLSWDTPAGYIIFRKPCLRL